MIESQSGENLDKLRVAVVHDWLVAYGGAERVLEQILALFPNADLYAVCDFFDDEKRAHIMNKKATTSFIQRLPRVRTKYRSYLALMPLAIERLDLSDYDLVISSSHAVAKGVITGPGQLHLCICYSPMRYAWDLTHQYMRQAGLTGGLKGLLAQWVLHRVRAWDVLSANRVDSFIAISHYISRRIWKVYRRESTVIYPPVDIDSFSLGPQKEDFYLTASRMVPYKRIDLIVESFRYMPDKKLIVIGDGPEFRRVHAKSGPNVTLLGHQPFEVLKDHMQRARAFLFAAEEDFGIVPLEAQACGTPVLAFAKGATLETIIDGKTGLFFDRQETSDIVDVVNRFEQMRSDFDPHEIRKNALRFSVPHFRQEFAAFVSKAVGDHFRQAGRF
jgi:glycosyltransferase involved in cell wall biosynthesis